MVAGPPLLQHGRVAYWGRGADDTGQGREPGCIEEDNRLPLGVCPLLRAGQVSSRQRAIAASWRCRARRLGYWGLQRIALSSRPTWTGWEATPHARRMRTATRARVQSCPRKP